MSGTSDMNRAAEEAGSYPWDLSFILSKAINLVC
jgi:hypothetical protein